MTRLSLLFVAATSSASIASAFTSVPLPVHTTNSLRQHARSSQLTIAMTSSSSNFDFFQDPEHQHHDGNHRHAMSQHQHQESQARRQRLERERRSQAKFVTGDALHSLRHKVLAMRLELQEARRSASAERVRELERAIIEAQQVDAEFVYTVSLERMERAQESGQFAQAELCKQQAAEARSALPQFNLEGLWVGKYGDHGYEMINVTYIGDTLIANKVTGTQNVPKGEVTFKVDLSPFVDPSAPAESNELLEPIELGDNAAKQWGSRYLQRFAGQGHVAAEGFQDSQWIDGQLIIVNKYFSFAWLPIGHQVFFGRPTAELILKLLKTDNQEELDEDSSRNYLERCWDETELLEDDDILDEDDGVIISDNDLIIDDEETESEIEYVASPQISAPAYYNRQQEAFYQMEGCFE